MLSGIELQEAWPPRDPAEQQYEWTQPASPWTYSNDGPNPALVPSNANSAQQLRARKRSAGAGVSAVPPYHPDYEPPAEEWEDGEGDYDYDGDDNDDDDGGERFAEYERGMARVRRGSEGYEVRPIDREQLLAEYIASRGQEAGRYRRYAPEPSESESGGEEVAVQDDEEEDEQEPLAVRLEKWRSGGAVAYDSAGSSLGTLN